MRPRDAAAILPALVLLVATACAAPAPEGRPVVVVSVLPQAWFVERLAGERVEVTVMIPPGASPATYEPTIAQMRAVSRAQLYVKVGHPAFPFERAWLHRLLEDNRGLRVIDGSAGLPSDPEDPHVWTSPGGARAMAEAIAAALTVLLPQDREAIAGNLAAVVEQIEATDREVRALLSGATGTSFLVFHPAWGRFAEAYGLRQVAIEHEGKEPDPHRLGRVVDWAREHGVRAIIVQPQFSHAGAEVVAREIGAELRSADPLSRDWPASMLEMARAVAGATASGGG